MSIAILDPFSGISGDMTLGALVAVGLDPEWLRALPDQLGIDGVTVHVRQVERAHIACTKVDFDIPPQPHGRHLRQIRALVEQSRAPATVKSRADAAFTSLATVEAEMHNTTVEKVHLHEVGAVDAILDVVGVIWGLERLEVTTVYCNPIALGDGTVKAAHGLLPVPAPATMRLLEGHRVRPGPPGSGELVTPTGAALVRTLSTGPPPREYVPRRSGFGAGTKEFPDRPNALRLILAEVAADGAAERESLVLLAADLDDMPPEYIAEVAERLRASGALDVVLTPTVMKKGRAGTRIEILATEDEAAGLEERLLLDSTTIGVRRTAVERRALPRERREVRVLEHAIAVKITNLPGGGKRIKPEFEDVRRVSEATGRPLMDIFRAAEIAAEHL